MRISSSKMFFVLAISITLISGCKSKEDEIRDTALEQQKKILQTQAEAQGEIAKAQNKVDRAKTDATDKIAGAQLQVDKERAEANSQLGKVNAEATKAVLDAIRD